MKKISKSLTRKVLCALLAAGIVGVSGSALANSIGTVTVDGNIVTVTPNGEFSIGANDSQVNISKAGTALAINQTNDVAKIKGKTIDILSENGCGFIVGNSNESVERGAHLYLGSNDTDKIRIDSGDDSIRLIRGYAVITAKEVSINCRAESGSGALWLQNNTQQVNAPSDAASLSIVADKINLTGKDLAVVAYSNSQLNIKGDVNISAKNAITTRGNATININTDSSNKTAINGDIVFSTPNSPGDTQNSGNLINAYVNVNLNGEDSYWTGRSYQQYKENGTPIDSIELTVPPYYGNVTGFKLNISDGAAWNMTGDSFANTATVKNGGVINVSEDVTTVNVENLQLEDGSVNLQGENQQVNVVKELAGNGIVSTSSLNNNLSVASVAADTNLTVKGSGDIADAIAADASKAQDLANVVTTTGGTSVASKITTDEGVISGVFSADVDENGNVKAGTEKTATNTSNEAISNMGSISLMTWRQENNDMNKRLGELRDSKGEHGAWARMARGESKYGAQNVKNQYNYYQVGYDEKLSTNPNWTVGVALTRTEGSSTFANGSGENKHTGFAVYGSYLNDNGSFIDLIAKYARLDNEFTANGGVGSGDYENNGYSLSAEYGKRFTNESGAWIEPQVELTYGKVSSADYLTSAGAKVHQNSMDSLVARLGFAVGKNIKQANVYARASYLYDFDGETDVMMSKDGAASNFSQDLGGGWWEVGVGTNINLSDATHLYFDVEKTFGGNVATPWQWNAGVRWSF